jgi:hypothetical protein
MEFVIFSLFARMVIGFTTTYAISSYHHWYREFDSHSGWGVQHYVIKFVSDWFSLPIKLRYCWKWH